MRLLLALPLLLAGCSLFDDGVAQPVDGPVVFSLPMLDPDGDGPEPAQRLLNVWTEEDYSCLLPLAVDLDRDGLHVRLEVLGIAEISACATAIGPASASLPLALGAGTYTFELEHLGRTDHYRLDVEGKGVLVETVEAEVSRYEEPGG